MLIAFLFLISQQVCRLRYQFKILNNLLFSAGACW
jgi:hypothetical protein